jgi:putative phosphoribosyl transferase
VDRMSVFADRADAGRRLAAVFVARGAPVDALVCGIPRGGVVVAAEVARALGCPLRAVVARKVGAPGHEELAIGAVGPDGVAVLDDDLVRRVGASPQQLETAVARAKREVVERMLGLPGAVDAGTVEGRHVIVVDDGVATGSTAVAVGRWLRVAGASRRVLALPVGPPDTVAELHDDYDEVVTVETPPAFVAVGQWYRDFTQVPDEEVRRLLEVPPGG